MKIISVILVILFLVFAAVQVNDPDPLLWIFIYLVMVGFSVMAFREKYYPRLMMMAALGYFVYGIILFPGVSDWMASEDKTMLFDNIAKMQYPYIEEAREFLGLLICLLVLLFFYLRSIRK